MSQSGQLCHGIGNYLPLPAFALLKRNVESQARSASPARQGGAFLATDEASARKKSPARAGLVLGTSSQARAQSSASMAGLGRRKGKAPVVTPEGLDRGKVGIRNRKLRAVCAFSNTQTVRFRYRDISANWPRRGAPRSGGYLRGGRSASCRADWLPTFAERNIMECQGGIIPA